MDRPIRNSLIYSLQQNIHGLKNQRKSTESQIRPKIEMPCRARPEVVDNIFIGFLVLKYTMCEMNFIIHVIKIHSKYDWNTVVKVLCSGARPRILCASFDFHDLYCRLSGTVLMQQMNSVHTLYSMWLVHH